MFGFGFAEVITIIVVMLVFIRPKDFPEIVRKIGKIYGKIMKQINMLKRTYKNFEQEINSVEHDIDGQKTKN